MKAGGFDAVIGNPPYGAFFAMAEKKYLDVAYSISEGNYDSFTFFMEKAISLLNYKGLLGFIIPDTWFATKSSSRLRKHILDSGFIHEMQILNQNVFRKGKVDVCTLIYSKGVSRDHILIHIYDKDARAPEIAAQAFKEKREVPHSAWLSNDEYSFTFKVDEQTKRLKDKMGKTKSLLSGFCLIGAGCKPYELGKGRPPQDNRIMKEKPYTTNFKKGNTFRLMLRGTDIARYSSPVKDDEWLSYGEWLAAPRNPDLFKGPRLLFQSIRNPKLERRLIGTFVDDDSVNNNSITNIVKNSDNEYDLKFFLGIMNSALLNWYFKVSYNIVNIDPRYLKMVPVHAIDFSTSADKSHHDKIVALVEEMLSLNKQLATAKTDHEKTALQRQIDATDGQIDKLVYELYGLTEEEIRIVEGGGSL
jgi:hypothetical protein